MYKLDISDVHGCDVRGGIARAKAISAVCPHCDKRGVFTLSNVSVPGPLKSISYSGACPACSNKIGFWSINTSSIALTDSVEFYMHPDPKELFQPPDEIDVVPEALRNALIATIDVYNAGIYTAAAVSGRRTLEGIFKYLAPEDKRNVPLAKLIDYAQEEKDLSAPLKALSHAIRSGGNLGAHFDPDNEPNEEVARQIVELLSYLVSYLYVLPAKIEQLERDLKNTPTTTSRQDYE